MFTSKQPEPAIVQQSSGSTPPPVLSPIVPVQRHRERMPKDRVAAIDLRIGLSMLGQEGRKLLAEYITIKQQRASEKNATIAQEERN